MGAVGAASAPGEGLRQRARTRRLGSSDSARSRSARRVVAWARSAGAREPCRRRSRRPRTWATAASSAPAGESIRMTSADARALPTTRALQLRARPPPSARSRRAVRPVGERRGNPLRGESIRRLSRREREREPRLARDAGSRVDRIGRRARSGRHARDRTDTGVAGTARDPSIDGANRGLALRGAPVREDRDAERTPAGAPTHAPSRQRRTK